MSDAVAGYQLLARARSRDARFPWVILCELPSPDAGAIDRYVVWYEDPRGRRSVGYYTTARDDAEKEFDRRS